MPKPDPALLDAARYPYSHTTTTRFADVDPNRHLNNVAIAAMFEDGRVRFNTSVRILGALEGRRGMVASMAIEYISEGYYPGEVSVHCAVESVGRSSWTCLQLLVQNGKVIALARSILVSLVGDTPTALPEDLRTTMIADWGLRH